MLVAISINTSSIPDNLDISVNVKHAHSMHIENITIKIYPHRSKVANMNQTMT